MKRIVVPIAAAAFLAFSAALSPAQALRSQAEFLRVEHPVVKPAVPAALREAQAALEKGSPDSLNACAKRLAEAGLLQDPQGMEVAGLMRSISAILYPGTPDGLPKDLPAYAGRYHAVLGILASGKLIDWIPMAGRDDFLTLVLPAFTLLGASAPVPDRLLQRLEENLTAADRLNPASVLPPYFRGLVAELRLVPDTKAALAFYRESAKRDASFQPAYRKAAALAPETGTSAGEAIPYLDTLLAKSPEDLALLKKLAATALASGDTQKALDATGKALLVAPGDVDTILMRASIYEAQENWYQALRIADILIKQSPDEPRAHLMKARLLYDHQGDMQEAIRIIDAAEPLFPGDAGFPELKGRILVETGREDEGIKALERALAIDPARLSTVRLLLQDSIRMKRWLQATLFLAQLLEKSETAEDLLMAYQVSSNLGDHEQALQYAEKLSHAMQGPKPLLMMGRSEIATGRKAAAVAHVDKGLADYADPAVRSELFYLRALTDREDPKAYVQDLRSSLLENPDNIEAILALSDAFIHQADYRLALIYLRRAVQLRPDDVGLGIQLKAVEKQVEQPQ